MIHLKPEHLPGYGREFETDNGVNIYSRIEYGKTRIFASAKDAEDQAKIRRSYVYPVYQNGLTNGYYAVPN